MKKPGLMLGVTALAGIVILIGAVAYISLLGENNKIDELVRVFFQDIRAGNYDPDLRASVAGPREDPMDALFLLDLALSKYYGLLGASDSEIVFRNSRLWIPFFGEGPISVDVMLRKKPSGGFFKQASSLVNRIGSSPGAKADFVKGLLTVERRNGNWMVTDVNVRGSAIEKVYAGLQEELRLQHYLTRTRRGFAMRAFEIDSDDMTFVDRQMLLHTLRKAQEWLGAPVEAPKADGGLPLPGFLKGR